VQWTNDDELFALLKTRLFTAAVGDVLDGMGLRHQFLPPHIQPLRSDMRKTRTGRHRVSAIRMAF
jgi:hypothetical protein